MSLLGMFLIYLAGTVFGIIWGVKIGKNILDVKYMGYLVQVTPSKGCPLPLFDKAVMEVREHIINEFDNCAKIARENLQKRG